MKLYHVSNNIVDSPKIIKAYSALDFGYGFYLTSSYDEAKKWAQRVKIRNNSKCAIINSFDFDLEKAEKELKIIKFNGPTKEWLLFVCNNRQNKEYKEYYDLVIGPVADDNVYSVISRFESGVYDLDETLKRLKIETLKDQILLHSEKSLNYLKFEETKEIYE